MVSSRALLSRFSGLSGKIPQYLPISLQNTHTSHLHSPNKALFSSSFLLQKTLTLNALFKAKYLIQTLELIKRFFWPSKKNGPKKSQTVTTQKLTKSVIRGTHPCAHNLIVLKAPVTPQTVKKNGDTKSLNTQLQLPHGLKWPLPERVSLLFSNLFWSRDDYFYATFV